MGSSGTSYRDSTGCFMLIPAQSNPWWKFPVERSDAEHRNSSIVRYPLDWRPNPVLELDLQPPTASGLQFLPVSCSDVLYRHPFGSPPHSDTIFLAIFRARGQ